MQRKLHGVDEVRALMDDLTDSKAAVGAFWNSLDGDGP